MHKLLTIIFSGALLTMAGPSSASVISTFNIDIGGWDSVGFSSSGTGYPNLSAVPIVSAVVYSATGGNSGGYISKQDPDGNWQYFRAPAAYLGNQSSALGGSFTFDLIRLDSFGTGVLNPQGPIVAATNGTLNLVYAGAAAIPTGTWGSYVVPLTANGNWKVTDPTGAAATQVQLNTVFAGLTGLFIQGDFLNGSGANGEIIGLDNVVLPSGVPEPGSAATCLAGLGLLFGGIWIARRKRLSIFQSDLR